MFRIFTTSTALLAVFQTAPAGAADVVANLGIDAVTVYARGTMVTRSGQVSFPAGSHRLIVRGLPAGLDSRLLRVTIGANGVRNSRRKPISALRYRMRLLPRRPSSNCWNYWPPIQPGTPPAPRSSTAPISPAY